MSSIQQLQGMYDNLETEFNRIKNETKKPENHPIQKNTLSTNHTV